jgi:cation transport regulator ChaB
MPPKDLPEGAKRIYVAAEASARKTTCKGREDIDACSNKIAWSAVKRKYKKGANDKWIPKAEVHVLPMAIVKASYDKATATRRWRAVASDTEEDSYKDSMSMELFDDFLHRIETTELPPEDFRSEFWSGGKPYLSVSHYPDLNGKGVPGPVDTVYIDGNRLKSTGRFDDTPIGRACFEAVCADLYGEDGPVPEDEKIRISIAFLDWKHRHKSTNTVFERSEDDPICLECLKEFIEDKSEGKEFLRGHLIHLGMTRVPVNKRTDMEVERSMTTRKDDAASIIGEELAEELDEETKMVDKSEALVVKAEEPLVEEAKKEMEEDEEEEDDEKKKKKKDEKKSMTIDARPFEMKALNLLEEIKSEISVEESEAHPLDGAIAELKSVYDVAVEMDDSQSALQAVQEPFEVLGRAIQENLVKEEPKEVQPESTVESSIAQMLSDFENKMSQEMGLLRAEMTASRSQVPEGVLNQVPERRSINPSLIKEQPAERKSEYPNLQKIVEKSVGL